MNSRRLKVLKISGEVLTAMFANGSHNGYQIIDGLPNDAFLIRVVEDIMTGAFAMIFQSNTFEDVPEGHAIPPLDIACAANGEAPRSLQSINWREAGF